jgi:hypothetical protein
MTKSETENWRLSDAPDGGNHRADLVTANGSAGPHLSNSAQDTEPLPAVEIHYPKSIENDARAYKSREERREQLRLLLEGLAVVVIFMYGALAYRQWHSVLALSENSLKTLQATERAYAAALRVSEHAYAAALQASGKTHVLEIRATERAYVTFGSKTGELGDFLENPIPGQRRIIALHFYNSGRSIARHLAVHVITDSSGPILRRHRFKGSQGDIVSTGVSTQRDLAAGAEDSEYIISPWSQRELAENMTENFTIAGQVEYCDAFGTYHCQEFRTNYMPNIRQFVPSSSQSCTSEPVDATGRPGKDYMEIEPCEQPDELEHSQTDMPRVAPGASTSVSRVERSLLK